MKQQRLIFDARPIPKPRSACIRRMAKNVQEGDWLFGHPWFKVTHISIEGDGAAFKFWCSNGETRTFSADWSLRVYRRKSR